MSAELIQQLGGPGGYLQGLIGNPIVTDTEITVTHQIHHVNGAGSISTINPPYSDFAGPIFLIATGGWDWVSSGNIAASSGGPMEDGTFAMFIRDRETGLWHPLTAIAQVPA